ncbi:transglycosylase family protein [Streptomyces enissocaesilis]|uniref:Resuscitation-promoting factor protein RpfC n=1 Tax=Streptomyces enissocaesilis TaxID=332589 RepID=A0ABN3XF45_9ACTN
MRSGNGRHRRPRQAPALVVAAGVAGSAIAIPLLGATGANAAEATTWDRVADCESGGMWSADLGNGYYGGLQFSPELWQRFGGTAYAPRADLASRSQQIQVAEKVLAGQGPQAWPSCALISGLTEGEDAAPGGGATAEPEAAPKAGSKADASAEAPESTTAPKASSGKKAAGAGKSAGPAATPPAGAADSAEAETDDAAETSGAPAREAAGAASGKDAPQGKHRGVKAREDAGALSGDSVIDRESGRHASRGDGPTRDAVGTSGAQGREREADAGEGKGEDADQGYTVRTGDNLWAIADAHDVRGGWPALYAANEKAVGSDPDLIVPGQSLDLD